MIELSDGRFVTSDEPVDLLTKMGAATLFGITADAVRTATVRGHVRTRAVLRFANRYDRLIDLRSAERYWQAKTRSIYYERDLADMRDRAAELWSTLSGTDCSILGRSWKRNQGARIATNGPARRRPATSCGSSEHRTWSTSEANAATG